MEFPGPSGERDGGGGGGEEAAVRPRRLKKCMKLNWDFQSLGTVGLRKTPFHRGGTGGRNIFWNYTILSPAMNDHSLVFKGCTLY